MSRQSQLEITDFGYDFGKLWSTTLEKMCSDLRLDVPYEGTKPKKPDFLWAVEKYYGDIRVREGRQKREYMRPGFGVRSYSISKLRQMFAIHNIRFVKATYAEFEALFASHMLPIISVQAAAMLSDQTAAPPPVIATAAAHVQTATAQAAAPPVAALRSTQAVPISISLAASSIQAAAVPATKGVTLPPIQAAALQHAQSVTVPPAQPALALTPQAVAVPPAEAAPAPAPQAVTVPSTETTSAVPSTETAPASPALTTARPTTLTTQATRPSPEDRKVRRALTRLEGTYWYVRGLNEAEEFEDIPASVAKIVVTVAVALNITTDPELEAEVDLLERGSPGYTRRAKGIWKILEGGYICADTYFLNGNLAESRKVMVELVEDLAEELIGLEIL